MEHIICTINLFNNFRIDGIIDTIHKAGGFQLSIIGMLTVFIGLVVIWAMVTLNRNIVSKIENKANKVKTETVPEASLSPMARAGEQNLEMLAAVIAASCAYCEEIEEDGMNVLHLHNNEVSPWVIVAREQMLRKH